jgi:hypothetical protein
MIIITEREISNGHGTGVLLKNITDAIDRGKNIVLCKYFMHDYDSSLAHYGFDDFGMYRGSKAVQKLLLSEWGSALYFFLKRPDLSAIPIDHHDSVFVTIYSNDVLWTTVKFIRMYPKKRYVLFMMDNFIDFSDTVQGRLNRKAFQFISATAKKRIAISKSLADQLKEVTNHPYTVYYGPRIIDWNKVDSYHKRKKKNEICLIGNVWVENSLPIIDEQLRRKNVFITWFTNETTFRKLQGRFSLSNFRFGGSFTSEEVIAQAAEFKYGLILFGLDVKSDNYYNSKLQEYSIPSKILDYAMGGLEPVYYGPEATACYHFLAAHQLGVLLNRQSAEQFFDAVLNQTEEPADFQKLKAVLQESSIEQFKKLLSQ